MVDIQRREAPVEVCQACKDPCCERLSVAVTLGPKMAELFSVHYGRHIEKVRFQVRHRCPHLDECGLCDLWKADPEQDQRPAMCQEFLCENAERPELLTLDVTEV